MYADNDKSAEQENFIQSVFMPGEDKNQGWIDVTIFRILELIASLLNYHFTIIRCDHYRTITVFF